MGGWREGGVEGEGERRGERERETAEKEGGMEREITISTPPGIMMACKRSKGRGRCMNITWRVHAVRDL